MYKKLIFFVLAFSFVLIGCEKKNGQNSNISEKALNIYNAKDFVKNYYSTNRYEQDVEDQTSAAKQYIDSRIENKKENEKLAVVFDLDDTMLSEYQYQLKNDFSQSHEPKMLWLMDGKMKPIKPVLELFNYAKSKNIDTIIITDRDKSMRRSTLKNLKEQGYKNWSQIMYYPEKNSYSNKEQYKTDMRKQLTDSGYTIIVNIGDQQSDLNGGYSEKTFKLPNYIYIIE
ncbi:MAG: HAD family acid phosphatase [Parachlamydiales bacterium]|nr:HAD family acid phosphatase [Parachlamydiales bacterium]